METMNGKHSNTDWYNRKLQKANKKGNRDWKMIVQKIHSSNSNKNGNNSQKQETKQNKPVKNKAYTRNIMNSLLPCNLGSMFLMLHHKENNQRNIFATHIPHALTCRV